jgi:hypothetical protein
MRIRFKCRHCGTSMVIAQRKCGRTVNCLACGQPTQVPAILQSRPAETTVAGSGPSMWRRVVWSRRRVGVTGIATVVFALGWIWGSTPSASVEGKTITPEAIVEAPSQPPATVVASVSAPASIPDQRAAPGLVREMRLPENRAATRRINEVSDGREARNHRPNPGAPAASLALVDRDTDGRPKQNDGSRAQIGRPSLRLPVWKQRTDEELRQSLVAAPEFLLDQRVQEALTNRNGRNNPSDLESIGLTAPISAGINGLPLRFGADCQSSLDHARALESDARSLKAWIAGRVSLPNQLAHDQWRRPETIPALMQVLTVEDSTTRRLLIRTLKDIPGPGATAALANRAIFDLNAEARRSAAEALRDRPVEEYLDRLLEAFRYPWAPAADHAAQAVVALNLQKATSRLRQMAEESDLTTPQPKTSWDKSTGHEVRELVRINHRKNCVLCHQMSADASDPARASISQSAQYYNAPNGPFIRADIVYLRQDFSVTQPTHSDASVGSGPEWQRYDYVVRTRTLKASDGSPFRASAQREAVQFALRALVERSEVEVARRND